MKKLIIKTALITFAAAIAFCAVLYGCIAAFSPSTLVGFYRDLGNDKRALDYSIRAYEKDGKSQDSIFAVIECSIRAEDDEKIIFFANELFSRKIENTDESYLSRIEGRLCRSLIRTGKKEEGVSKAAAFSAAHLKTEDGAKLTLLPSEDLIAYAAELKDTALLKNIYLSLCAVKDQMYDLLCESGKARLNEDILKLSAINA